MLLNTITIEIINRINVEEQVREVEKESNKIIGVNNRNIRRNNIKFTKTIHYVRGDKENKEEKTREKVVKKEI